MTFSLTTCSLTAAALVFAAGCASKSPEQQPQAVATTPGLPAGVTLHKDKDIQGVWLAPDFNFKGYDVLLIEPTQFAAVERPNEVEMRNMAVRVLRDQLVSSFEETGLFRQVTTREEDVKPDAKVLRLHNTITEYQKGGGGARYFAGFAGGGQPVIKVRGEFRNASDLKCVYEARRSGEGAGARMSGVWMKDEEIQRNDIRDLGNDLADFLRRTAGLPEKQK